MKTGAELREQLRTTQQQVAAAVVQGEQAQLTAEQRIAQLRNKSDQAEAKLLEAKRVHEESEAMLQDRLNEVTNACEESEGRLKEQHKAINEVYESLHESSHWPHLNHLHSALQASETQVLKVTRDRLVLLGEKSKLQAQLLSVQAQTSLLQDSLCEDDATTTPGLHQQLTQVQAAVRNLQEQGSRLQSANSSLSKEKEQLEEKLAGYRAVEKLANKSDITLETVKICDPSNSDGRLNTIAMHQLQRNHSLLQQDYTHLQKLYNLLQEEEKRTCQKLHICNISLQKAQLNIDVLTEQYQDKIQLLQKECDDKLIGAQSQLTDVQGRYQVRVKETEEKLFDVQSRCKEKLIELETNSAEECSRLETKLHELLQQLDSERKASDSLRAELRSLRQRYQQMDRTREL